MIRLLLINILSIFGYNFNKPVRLEKQETKSKFQRWADKACPYIIIIGIILLAILLFIILIKYGGAWFSTPQNRWEHMGGTI